MCTDGRSGIDAAGRARLIRCGVVLNERILGCRFTSKGAVHTDRLGCTTVPGVYVVGDASRDAQFVIVAAAEGVKAAVAINTLLQKEDEAIITSEGATGLNGRRSRRWAGGPSPTTV